MSHIAHRLEEQLRLMGASYQFATINLHESAGAKACRIAENISYRVYLDEASRESGEELEARYEERILQAYDYNAKSVRQSVSSASAWAEIAAAAHHFFEDNR